MAEQEIDRRSSSDREREQRLAYEKAQREERRAREQAERDQRRAREAAARDTRPTKTSQERQTAREEAKGYGIDTKGMSTREIKAAILEASTVEKKLEDDMGKFIEKTLNNFITKKSGEVAPSSIAPPVTNRISEDKATLMPSSASSTSSRRQFNESIKFFCYSNGSGGYLELFGDPEFKSA